MKMKSKFFGISTKLVLALLAFSGTMLTSCYETENGDVKVPFELPDPAYAISGRVVDGATGLGIPGATVNASLATTDAQGNYNFMTTTAGTLNLTFAKADYKDATASVNITALKKGQLGSYVISVTMFREGYVKHLIPIVDYLGVEFVNIATFKADEIHQVDWVNNSATEGMDVSLKITVDSGYKYEDAAQFNGISPEFKAAIIAHINDYFGEEPVASGAAFNTKEDYYKLVLAPLKSLESVTVTTSYYQITLMFIYGGETAKITVLTPYWYEYSNKQRSNAHGHGLGHGNGHGDDLNAGGGALDPVV